MDRRNIVEAPERRMLPVGEFEFRANTGPTVSLTGYASVFNHDYAIYGGAKAGGWDERVDPGAFQETLSQHPDLHLLVNHEGLPLARTKSGTLHLSTDKRGLHVAADLDTRDPDVQRIMTKMERGDLSEMSFGFRTKRDAWSEDETRRTLLEVSLHKGDVSVVNFGANPATSAELNMRAALDYVAALDEEDALAEVRKLDLSPDERALVKARLVRLAQRVDPPKKKTLSLAEALRITGA